MFIYQTIYVRFMDVLQSLLNLCDLCLVEKTISHPIECFLVKKRAFVSTIIAASSELHPRVC